MDTQVEAKKGTGGKIAKGVAAAALAGCLVASLGLNIYQAQASSKADRKTADYIDYMLDRIAKEEEQTNEYMEDGFKVGGEYEIRSTTHISDAYKSGDSSQLSEQDKETLDMASAVLDEVIEDGMGNYEKELAVYQWMVENLRGSDSGGVIGRPGGSGRPFTPHDVLASHDAVCVGYATTFRLFMNMLGMDVHIVHNEYHSWDLVELEEDQWYHVDVYSDVHGAMYGNFNMTDSICNMGHNWDESALPAANSVKYTPAVRNSVELDSLMDLPAKYKQSIDEGQYGAYYRFKTPLTEEEIAQANFLVNAIDSALDMSLEGWHYFRAYWYPDEDGNDILGLTMEMDREEESGGVSLDADSPEGRAILQAIAEAFELDPESLGLVNEDGSEDIDWSEIPIGGADGPTSTFVDEDGNTVTTWQGGGGVVID